MTETVWHENGSRAAIPDPELRQAALAMLHARRAMRGTLPEHLIHDVALEMLLAIYLANGTPLTLEDLLDGTAVTTDLAKRWLAALLAEHLAEMIGEDVALTPAGQAAMTDMLTKVVRSQRDLLGWANH